MQLLALALGLAAPALAQQPASTTVLASATTPYQAAPAAYQPDGADSTIGADNTAGADSTPGADNDLVSASAYTQRLPQSDNYSDSASDAGIADLRRRLEATETELDALRAEQAQILGRKKQQGYFASMQSGSDEKGVEDRIANLERQAEETRGKLPLIRLSGFFQLDTGQFSQDAASKYALGDIQDGTGFRRARLQGLGKLTEFTNYSIEMDFAFPGRPSFMDVWGEQTNLPIGNLRIGQYRLPVTMDSWTSIRHLEFLERSAPFIAFDPFRRVGIMDWYVTESGRTLVAASVFGTGWTFFNNTAGVNSATGAAGAAAASTQYNTLGLDNRYGTELGDNGGVGIASRMSHLLYYDDLSDGRYLLHLGGGYTFAQIGGGGVGSMGSTGQTYRASTIPEFFVGDQGGGFSTFAGTPNVLDTGRFLAKNYSLYHVELAGNAGSFHWQTEALGTAVAQYAGPLVLYGGAYAQCGYFLTGESAGYNKQMGALDYNCKPFREFMGTGFGRGMCGWGAWELAGRWSYVDLQTNRINPANYQGLGTVPAGSPAGSTQFNIALPGGPSAAFPNPGVLNESTVALNWYWNQYTRVQFNWIHNMLSSQYRGYSVMDAFTARYQIEF